MENRGEDRIRLVSMVEAETVTGPMKPLLMFTRHVHGPGIDSITVSHSAVTTVRTSGQKPLGRNAFLRAADDAGLPIDLLRERFLFDWSILSQLAECLADRKPDVVETHDVKSHFIMWLLKMYGRIQGARWAAFHHGYTRTSARVFMYQQLDRISLRAADRVVTVCEPFVHQLVRRGVNPSKITILKNAVEERARPTDFELQCLRRRLGLQTADRIILSVGRLSPEKGHKTLIAAYRQLRLIVGMQDLRLVLVGDGGHAKVLKSAAADLGSEVLFVGHVEDPWPFYCLADVFVLPSHSEGSPLALFEAMSAALPIIASAVGGVPETLCNGVSAVLVSAGSEPALARALEHVLSDAKFADSIRRGARAAVEECSPVRYIGQRLRH